MSTAFKPAVQQLQAEINSDGLVRTPRNAYIARNVARFGPAGLIPASRTIAARMVKRGDPPPRSTVTTVGEAPDGFGKQVLWDPADSRLALAVFLNAGDPLGVMISGVKPTDTIRVISATGLASFAEDVENEHVGAIIGIVAVGATATAAAFGAPEAKPAIDAGAAFAQDQFKEKLVKTKVRDPFGEDPGSGHKARQEGGVIVSMPEAGQIYYSGNGDHKERWIKKPGTRNNAHRPDHVRHAHFLRTPTTNQHLRRTLAAGDFIISAWDHAFTDNFGFYRLHVLVKRGDGQLPDNDVD